MIAKTKCGCAAYVIAVHSKVCVGNGLYFDRDSVVTDFITPLLSNML
jgi:hypothetical protein